MRLGPPRYTDRASWATRHAAHRAIGYVTPGSQRRPEDSQARTGCSHGDDPPVSPPEPAGTSTGSPTGSSTGTAVMSSRHYLSPPSGTGAPPPANPPIRL